MAILVATYKKKHEKHTEQGIKANPWTNTSLYCLGLFLFHMKYIFYNLYNDFYQIQENKAKAVQAVLAV